MSLKTPTRAAVPAWLPPVAPFVLFLLLTSIEGQFTAYYPVFYALKIALVCATLFVLRPALTPLSGRDLGLAVGAGVVLVFAWVGVDRHTPHLAFLGGRVAYDPFRAIAAPGARDAFLAVRFFGLAVIVPIIEEGFYRGFLLRYITDMDDFRRVPVGAFSAVALAANVGLFALSHPEWLAAAAFALAMCGLLAWTKNLSACAVAHGVTNLLLGLYVLHSHQWQYW